MKRDVRFVENRSVDRKKWNKCIQQSYNGLIYARDWYLDLCADHWDALVMGDYTAVMPLPTIERRGIKVLYQPPFCVQLGMFSTAPFSQNLLEGFIEAIPPDYRYVNINLNKYNYIGTTSFHTTEKKTCELDLIGPYKKLYAGYHGHIKQVLSGASGHPLKIDREIELNEFARQFGKSYKGKTSLRKQQQNILHTIAGKLLIKKTGEVWAARNRNNELCATALFAKANHKSILLAHSLTGKDGQMGLTAIIDHYIKTNSEKNSTLDFRQADTAGALAYYRGFGAAESRFINLKKNKLPWYYKLFIK